MASTLDVERQALAQGTFCADELTFLATILPGGIFSLEQPFASDGTSTFKPVHAVPGKFEPNLAARQALHEALDIIEPNRWGLKPLHYTGHIKDLVDVAENFLPGHEFVVTLTQMHHPGFRMAIVPSNTEAGAMLTAKLIAFINSIENQKAHLYSDAQILDGKAVMIGCAPVSLTDELDLREWFKKNPRPRHCDDDFDWRKRVWKQPELDRDFQPDIIPDHHPDYIDDYFDDGPVYSLPGGLCLWALRFAEQADLVTEAAETNGASLMTITKLKQKADLHWLHYHDLLQDRAVRVGKAEAEANASSSGALN